MRSRKIECRVYDKDKFHAKAYITHAKLEVVGSQALVGSSNFTYPGLTENIELNVQIQSAREVAQLQEWFEAHWKDAAEVTDELVEVVEKHVRESDYFAFRDSAAKSKWPPSMRRCRKSDILSAGRFWGNSPNRLPSQHT